VALPLAGLTLSQLGTVVRSTWKNRLAGFELMLEVWDTQLLEALPCVYVSATGLVAAVSGLVEPTTMLTVMILAGAGAFSS